MDKNSWDDDVLKGVRYVHNLMDFILRERGQLYGAMIHLMKLLEKDKVEFPPIETFQGYGRDYYLISKDDEEDGKFYMYLKEQEKNDPILDKSAEEQESSS